MLLELALADADRRSDADHRRLIAPMIPFSRCISTTSPPGLTRGSIISSQEVLPRRWIAGSSPAMTSHEQDAKFTNAVRVDLPAYRRGLGPAPAAPPRPPPPPG